VTLLAVSMVVFSLLNVVLLSLLSDVSLATYLKKGVFFLSTCILAYFLIKGARWARWVTIIIALLYWIALLVVVYFVLVFPSRTPSEPFFSWAWMLVAGLFWLIIGLLLLFSKDIVGHFVSHQP
jgi:uncharacterized membrane protein HdeD (DUF308 family)